MGGPRNLEIGLGPSCRESVIVCAVDGGGDTAVGPISLKRLEGLQMAQRGPGDIRNQSIFGIAHDVVARLDFLCPLTSKNAFGFEIIGSKNPCLYSRAFYLRKQRALYRPYGKTCRIFQTRRLVSK